MQLFSRHREEGGAGGDVSTAYRRQVAELAYHRRATSLLNDEYCFRIVFVSLSLLMSVLVATLSGCSDSHSELHRTPFNQVSV